MAVFVDSENVSRKNPYITLLLGESSVYIVFCISGAQDTVTRYKANVTLNAKAQVAFCLCETGTKNALDFQLVGLVGQHLAIHPKDIVRILSADTGYDAAVALFCRQGFDVQRISPISDPYINDVLKRIQEAKSAPSTPATLTAKPEQPERAMPETPEQQAQAAAALYEKNAFIAEISMYALSKLSWQGYKNGEKQKFAAAIAEFAFDASSKEAKAKGIYGYAGHAMKGVGNIRFITMYKHEKKIIESILKSAAEMKEKIEL